MSEVVHYYAPQVQLTVLCGRSVPRRPAEVTGDLEEVTCGGCLEAMAHQVTQAMGRTKCVGCGHDLGFHSLVVGCVSKVSGFRLSCKCTEFV